MLTLKHVTKTFHPGTANEKRALNDLSLRLETGEFVTIIGSNGAGKSTMFNAICGTFPVDEGAIFLDGKNMTGLPDYRRASVIGRVFQDPMKGTAPNMTIEENLALAYAKGTRGPLAFALNKKETGFLRDGPGGPHENQSGPAFRWAASGCDPFDVYHCPSQTLALG